MRRHQKIRVAFLTRYNRSRASSRVRVYDYIPHLTNLGLECRAYPLPQNFSSTFTRLHFLIRALWLAHWADVVVLQKMILREEFVNLLKRVNPRVIFDFDDAVWTPPDTLSDDPVVQSRYQVIAKRFHHLLRQVRCVVVGSHYLAQYAKQWTSSVYVVPSSVDLEHYPIKPPSDGEHVVFGWIGSPENLLDFNPIRGILKRVFQVLNTRAVLKIVSTQPLYIDGIPMQFERWQLDQDIVFLHSFDIGLMPLSNTERSRGRCGFKAIQYMAVGLPVVASPVGAAVEIIEHEKTGFLAHTEKEWEEALIRLSVDGNLRMRLGKAGRARVERLYSIQANAPKLAAILQEVASS